MTDQEKLQKSESLLYAFAELQQITREQKDEALKQVNRQKRVISSFLSLLPESWGDQVIDGRIALEVPEEVIEALIEASE